MIRVLVVDDYKPWHKFVTVTLETDPRCKVIGLASDGPVAIEMCRVLRPDVIILDINLSDWNGMLVAQKMQEVVPDARIIFFSNHISFDFISAAFEVGARGFVAKRMAGSYQ